MFKRKDKLERPRTELDELWARVTALQSDVERLQTSWEDTKDQVRRSYQRLEKAAQRAEARRLDDEAGHQVELEARTEAESPEQKQLRLWRRSSGVR